MVRLYKFYTTRDTKFTQEQSKCRVYNNASNSRRFRSDIEKFYAGQLKNVYHLDMSIIGVYDQILLIRKCGLME